ncbi:MAG: hypothetical protein AAGN64_02415, partial [Bacteroidota bacterium]
HPSPTSFAVSYQPPTTFADARARINAARRASDLFGTLDGDAARQHDALRERYRAFAFIVHADRNGGDPGATTAFQRLGTLYESAQQQLRLGTYRRPHALAELRHADVTYRLHDIHVRGDVADLYRATAETERGTTAPVLVKGARSSANNDLLANEAWALRRLRERVDPRSDDAPLLAHVSPLRASFNVKGRDGTQRRTNVFDREDGWVSLADVKRAYPAGIHPADMAWMFNRLLAALALTHGCGLVHGAVVPAHVLVRPADHHGRLIDWGYAVPLPSRSKRSRSTGSTPATGLRVASESIRAISPPYHAFYPAEVLGKQSPTPGTDLYMAALTMLWLVGGDEKTQTPPAHLDPRLVAFFRSCLLLNPARRPQDAWALFGEFRDLLQTLYGPPRFRPFAMPSNPT